MQQITKLEEIIMKFKAICPVLFLLLMCVLACKSSITDSIAEDKSKVKNIMGKMTLQEKLGQLIVMGFRFWGKDEDNDYVSAGELNPTIRSLIKEYHLGGLILFRENTATPAQIVQLVEEIQATAKIPLLLGVDQEGGVVTRLQTGTDMPGNMALGAANDYALTKKVAGAIGRELKVLGLNLNLAPVIDVNSSASNPVIGIRSFSSSPNIVKKMGEAYIEGLKEASVMSCVKHFPGHGNTVTNTHLELATVNYSYEKLKEIDLKPFEMAIETGTDMVMIAHVIVPVLDDTKQKSKKDGREIGTPATLSYEIITNILRNQLKFNGLVLADALDMQAISDNFGNEEATVTTIMAGSDMVILPVRIWEEKDIYKLDDLFAALEKEYSDNLDFRVRVEESVERIISLKIKNGIFKKTCEASIKNKIEEATKVVGCDEHKIIEREASLKGITLIKNTDKVLPFKLENNSKILVLDSNRTRINIFIESIKRVSEGLGKSVKIDKKLINFTDMLNDSLKEQILKADFIILLTYNLNSSKTLPEQIAAFSDSNNKKLVSIATRNPYDIAFIPSSKANIAVYGAVGIDPTSSIQGILSVNIETGAEALFANNDGKPLLDLTGKLPVTIQDPVTKKIIYKIGHGLMY